VVDKGPTGGAATAERPAGLHADRDPQIFAAVLELLRDIGYERMTIDGVAARARVSKATIYRRWPGKPQMVADALRNQKFEVHVPVDTGTLRGDLLAMLRAAARMCTADISLVLAVSFAMHTNPELAGLMREHVLPAKRMETDGIIDHAMARGEIAPDECVRELFHGLAPALLMSRLAAEGLPTDDEYLQCVVDHVLLPVLKQ
jgi:AcrR family transcriptional regulator